MNNISDSFPGAKDEIANVLGESVDSATAASEAAFDRVDQSKAPEAQAPREIHIAGAVKAEEAVKQANAAENGAPITLPANSDANGVVIHGARRAGEIQQIRRTSQLN